LHQIERGGVAGLLVFIDFGVDLADGRRAFSPQDFQYRQFLFSGVLSFFPCHYFSLKTSLISDGLNPSLLQIVTNLFVLSFSCHISVERVLIRKMAAEVYQAHTKNKKKRIVITFQ